MTVVLVAVGLGCIAGLLTGGRPVNVGEAKLRSVPLLVAGALGQAVVTGSGMRGGSGLALVIVSFLALAAFATRNLHLAGMGVVVLGVVLNLAPIALNAGMPVEERAIVRARIASPDEVPSLEFGAKRHLARPGDHMRALDDAIPEWITHEVLSIGDLVIGAGVAAVVFSLLRAGRGGRHAGPAASG
jgi:hypothetical protein